MSWLGQTALPDAHQRRINDYVPAMSYAADVRMSAPTRVSLGTPAVASGTALATATAITNAALSIVLSAALQIIDGRYGRALSLTGGTGGDNAVVTLVGRDYLGQPLKENFTLNGTTPVNGVKAFKYLDSVDVAAGNANASSDLDIGTQDLLGLPYKPIKVLTEELDGVIVGTLGTITSPVLTDPQTITTGEPRGLYNPQSTLNGTAEITATFMFDNSVNSSGNGGLHGIAHFYS